MRRFAFFCCGAILLGCGKSEVKPARGHHGRGSRSAREPSRDFARRYCREVEIALDG